LTSSRLQYNAGIGVPQNYAKGVYWLQKAAQQGVAEAEDTLGDVYYYFGHGVPQNYAKGVYWYQKAARQGVAEAENRARSRMNCNTYGPKWPEVINGQVLQSVEC